MNLNLYCFARALPNHDPSLASNIQMASMKQVYSTLERTIYFRKKNVRQKNPAVLKKYFSKRVGKPAGEKIFFCFMFVRANKKREAILFQ
ncbi:MAG: hypothetical protein NT126_08275 [Bacteroidetes bacterium]|nr:hypothetical protein [Bacteroidota bacterium]